MQKSSSHSPFHLLPFPLPPSLPSFLSQGFCIPEDVCLSIKGAKSWAKKRQVREKGCLLCFAGIRVCVGAISPPIPTLESFSSSSPLFPLSPPFLSLPLPPSLPHAIGEALEGLDSVKDRLIPLKDGGKKGRREDDPPFFSLLLPFFSSPSVEQKCPS